MKEAFKSIARNDMIKTIREMSERGFSCAMIARCMDLDENEVRFLVRRE
jgi:orotate phosphoribosyltransferase-like protein